MIYYVLSDGRIVSDKEMIGGLEYVEVPEYPETIIENGKYKVVVGCENGALKYEYFDIPEEPEPEEYLTQADRIEQQNLFLMEAISEQYEEQQKINLMNMETQATIYEKLIFLEGGK